MAFCENCGKKLEDGARFCGECGAVVKTEEIPVNTQQVGQSQPKVQNMPQQPQAKKADHTTAVCTEQEIKSGKLMSVVAYFGILVLIPLFVEKKNRFVRFHVNQGIILLLASLAIGLSVVSVRFFVSVSFAVAMILLMILGIISFVLSIFSLIGIVNAIGGKTKPIPIIGKIQFLK